MSEEPGVGSERWRTRMPLSGTDVCDFLALRRVCGHPGVSVHRVGGDYVENGWPLLPFLADGVTALIDVGHLTLGDPDPGSVSCDMLPVVVTAAGRARYEDLCDRQGLPAYPDSLGKEATGR